MFKFFSQSDSHYPKLATFLKVTTAFNIGLFIFAGTMSLLDTEAVKNSKYDYKTYFSAAFTQLCLLPNADKAADFVGNIASNFLDYAGDGIDYVTSFCRNDNQSKHVN